MTHWYQCPHDLGAGAPTHPRTQPGVAGMSNQNVLPAPGADRTRRSPPWARTIWRAIGRPRPVPRGPSGHGVRRLAERLEDPLVVGLGDAPPGVRDLDPDRVPAVVRDAHPHAALRG